MIPDERQAALERHGLRETPDGYELLLRGFQRASERALALRAQGDREAAWALALGPSDERRWEFCRCVALDALSREG
ncbi:hypothetical protein OH738_10670 [Streptomyces hirsutus]|uniref:Uncharacterized protein n=1 Tax=Streptomyces hirsutus TaxID=35620 RepID=A0ABZ1GV88_9ACTN|nr:hypothetical protein [Streptomyces hirsutus]WSD09348.1 hypothetical protein OIE73_28805 [Streptomyces hirsutus]WTD17202.1 hypothetical protein OH738_10670 [Streptomyces hirsutus]